MKRRDRKLTIKATPGFEHLAGEQLTLNGKIATPALMQKTAGKKCGICGGIDVRSYVSFVVSKGTHAETMQAFDAGDADGRVYPICVTCESLGQETFLPAMERRLRADLLIEAQP